MDDKEDIKQALNAWFEDQDKWATKKELAAELGISHSTVRKYFSEGRIPRKPENRDRLYQLTELSCLDPDSVTPQDSESQKTEVMKPEPKFKLNRPTIPMIMSMLNNALEDINKDVSERVKIRSFIQSLSRAWEKGDLDTVVWMAHSDIREVLRRHYPQVEGIFEEIDSILKRHKGQEIDEFEFMLEHYCEENGIKLTGNSPQYVVDHLIHVNFERERNLVTVGISRLQNPEWEDIRQSIEGEHKRIWARDFSFSEFYEELLMSYNDIMRHQRNDTDWVFLTDIYQEIKKRKTEVNSSESSMTYPEDEFSADLSKLFLAQSNNYNAHFQIEFSSNRDPRFCFEVILPDESTASYAFMRPRRPNP